MSAGASRGKEAGHRDALAELTCELMTPPNRDYAGGTPFIGETCPDCRHALRNGTEPIHSTSSFEAPQLAALPRSSASLFIKS